MDRYIGRLLENRYEILEQIGTGGMAVVYKARCHRLNRLVAIKILKEELSEDAEFRRRFHAESQAVAMLSHTNIVNVYDVSHWEDIDYIVMELIDGITLKQYMQQKGVLNWREALHFSTQIAKALEHAHSRGIIHRDIKPHNIMILKDGSVKVADFGIARVSSAQSTLTREALGSVHYISPEQAKGSKIDYRSDLYSLGVVMYEMMTGRPPYDGESPVSVAIQHINAQAPMPRSINPQIPVGLEQICMHAMTADLEDRYESATEMLCDLDEFRRNPNVNFAAAPVPVQHVPAGVGKTAADRAVRSKTGTQVKRPEQHRSGRSGSAGLVAGIICIALALCLIGYFLYSFFFADFFTDTAEIEVPEFVGKYAEEIDNNDYPNFQIHIKEWVPNDTVPSGQVLEQDPYAGRMVKSGSTIELTVSAGPSTDTMRNLVNSTLSNARTILDNLGLSLDIRVEYESSEVCGKDCVIRTEPAKDEPLSAGQTVILYVSTGPDITLIPVPELVGMDIDAAIDKLDSLNLLYGVSYVFAEEAEGTVIFQSIKQQDVVKEGTTINLQVSKGPRKEEEEEEPEQEEETEDSNDPVFSDPVVIWIPLPEGSGTVEISIFLDDELDTQLEMNLITASDRGLPYAPLGVSGTKVIRVYLDNVVDGKVNTANEPWWQMQFNFDTGEQVEE